MQIRKSILISVIIVVCLGSYFNALFGDFVYDDNIFITPNPYIRSFKYLPKFFVQDFSHVGTTWLPVSYYRPLFAASYMLDYTFWKYNPFGYHLTNIIFHILASILVFLFLELLFKNKVISFFSSLLFSVHPIHAGAVSFISGRVDVIPLVFFLLSIVLFLKYTLNKNNVFYLLSLFSFLIALFFKESVVILPIVIICIDYFFISKFDIKNLFTNLLRIHLSFFIVLGIYLVVRFSVGGIILLPETPNEGVNFFIGTHNFWRIFTVIKILAIYMGLLFLPYSLRTEYFFPPANSLFEPVVLIGLGALSLLVFIFIKNLKKNPILSFSILWFFITVLPVGNIFPQGNIFAERYMYIPSVGFCMAIGFVCHWLLNKNIKTSRINWKKPLYVLFFLLIVAFGRLTYERNKIWHDDLTLWADTVKASPQSAVAHCNLAIEYSKLNLLDDAQREAKMAVQLDPLFSQAEAVYVYGNILLRKGLIEEAINTLKAITEIFPGNAGAYVSLAIAYGMKGQYKESIGANLAALKNNPYLDIAHYNLALNYSQIGLIDEAINAYEEYLNINPNYFGVYVDVGYLYYKKGDYQKARERWLTALKLSQDYQPVKDALKLLEK